MDLKNYVSQINNKETEDLNLGIKDSAGNDIYVKVLKSL